MTANYSLYESDNTTLIAIPQPRYATWETQPLDAFTSGVRRVSRYRHVRWEFDRMSQAEYEVFTANRPTDGVMQFKTYRGAVGASPGAWVQCAGIMEPIVSGNEHEGEIHGVYIEWSRVETV